MFRWKKNFFNILSNFDLAFAVPLQTSDPQTSDVIKVGQYKRRTGIIYKKKRRTLVEFEKNIIALRNKLKITPLL